ncbi:insulinase family protein [Marinimicrobium alkaliphilum]|uniref:insulinase family protein n=1 Tax=Marinimicrobium alkaliphilum TaxID=2202654 RepID=UPI000DB9EFB9|nr:insulinase family protein [Marinimicrobium alkaliphilum]
MKCVVRSTRYCVALLLVALGLSGAASALATTVIQSESDEREYRYLTLPNGLQLLLVSDPEADKAAAAVDVRVGSHQNEPGREGLAHFLEHMLFLGTKKYPDAGEYQRFINQHGGSHNAYTAAENTNYFFRIDPDYLEPAFDRFAQFFIAPLFDEDYVERERRAVHSEFTTNINQDARRTRDVYRELFNPEHPASRFTVGNVDTLADREDGAVRDDLVAFYERFYSAHLMSAVVLGRESLDDLEKLAVPRLREIKRRDVSLPERYPPLFPKDALPAMVRIEPRQETRTLSFLFPIPDDGRHYREKPVHYLAHMLGHEGEGSLLSLLRDLGWAEGIQAGRGLSSRNDGVFQLTVELTELGVRAQDQIQALVHYVIQRLDARGVREWRYRELQQLADIDFRFQERVDPMRTVSALANRLHRYAPEDVLYGDYQYARYNERLIKRFLSHLRPDNVLVSLVAPDLDTDRVSAFYETPYALGDVAREHPEIKLSVRRQLSFPEANDFIPQRLNVKAAPMLPASGAESDRPELIVDSERLRAWFQQDQTFRVPKAHLNMRLYSPRVASSVEGAAQARLFAELVMDDLNEFAYPAKLAGLDFSVEGTMRGLDIRIAGYSSRQGLLITRIAESIRQGEFASDRFDNVRTDLIRRLRNENQVTPYSVLAWQIPVLQFDPYHSNDALIGVLEGLDRQSFQQFANRLLHDARMEALFYGNLFRQEGVRLAAFAEHQLLGPRTGRSQVPGRVFKMKAVPEGQPALYRHRIDHPDHVALLYIQGLGNSLRDTAHMRLLQQIVQPAFYNELRTEKQLGYVVALWNMPLRDLQGKMFVIQSPDTPEAELIEEIEAFLKSQREHVLAGLVLNQQAMVRDLREPAQSLAEQSGRYWDSLVLGDVSFARRDQLADAVAAVTPESLLAYYEAVLLQPARRLWLTTDKFNPEAGFEEITDPAEFRRGLDALIFP